LQLSLGQEEQDSIIKSVKRLRGDEDISEFTDILIRISLNLSKEGRVVNRSLEIGQMTKSNI